MDPDPVPAAEPDQPPASYDLHQAVFRNDLPALSGLLRGAGEAKAEVEQKDMHGNTALHLAVMLGRRECVQVEMNIDDTVTFVCIADSHRFSTKHINIIIFILSSSFSWPTPPPSN